MPVEESASAKPAVSILPCAFRVVTFAAVSTSSSTLVGGDSTPASRSSRMFDTSMYALTSVGTPQRVSSIVAASTVAGA